MAAGLLDPSPYIRPASEGPMRAPSAQLFPVTGVTDDLSRRHPPADHCTPDSIEGQSTTLEKVYSGTMA